MQTTRVYYFLKFDPISGPPYPPPLELSLKKKLQYERRINCEGFHVMMYEQNEAVIADWKKVVELGFIFIESLLLFSNLLTSIS